MIDFQYARATDVADAVRRIASTASSIASRGSSPRAIASLMAATMFT